MSQDRGHTEKPGEGRKVVLSPQRWAESELSQPASREGGGHRPMLSGCPTIAFQASRASLSTLPEDEANLTHRRLGSQLRVLEHWRPASPVLTTRKRLLAPSLLTASDSSSVTDCPHELHYHTDNNTHSRFCVQGGNSQLGLLAHV